MNHKEDSTNKADPRLNDLYRDDNKRKPQSEEDKPSESGGPKGLEPTPIW